MKIFRHLCFALVLIGIFYAYPSLCQISKSALPQRSVISFASHSLAKAQTIFIENKGQLADQNGKPIPEVLFSSDANGVKCYLTKKGIHCIFSRTINAADTFGLDAFLPPHIRRMESTLSDPDTLILQRLDMQFTGANPNPRIEAVDQTDGYYNYYLNYCKLTGLRGYKKIIYHDLYPHIDFVIYSNDAGTEYDFIVHPGGNPDRIAMSYSGMDSLHCSMDGRFDVYTPLGILEEDEPNTYQKNDGLITVSSHFILTNSLLRFAIGNYNKSLDLVIDPIRRMWGTYYGGATTDGSTAENAQSPVVDKGNNIVFCGSTQSTAGISTTGAYQTSLAGAHDAYIAKFSPSGNLVWATYYGGSQDEFCGGLALDSNNNLILYGETLSSSGIATTGANQTILSGQSDAFLAKFDNAGMLQWATYFGGDGGEETGGMRSVACDRGGHIYITGSTLSHNGLTTPGAWDTVIFGLAEDAFLARFNSSGTLLWATLYGGTLDDHGLAITIDFADNVYFGGSTSSTSSVATSTGLQSVFGGGQKDAFLAKFNSVGALNWATYYGGSGDDYLLALCTDSNGNIYGCGYTSSSSGISTAGAFQQNYSGKFAGDDDGFIFKFNSAGKRQWGTYFGGEYNDIVEDIVLNAKELVISGETQSSTSMVTPDAFQSSIAPRTGFSVPYLDGFLAKFNYAGSRLWATYYGGQYTDYGYGCTVDRDNNLFLVGETQSPSNIATAGAHRTIGGSQSVSDPNLDAYIVKFCDMVTPVLTGKVDTICTDGIDTLHLNQGYDQIDWFDGTTPLISAADSLFYILPSPQTQGLHSIYVHVSNGAQCDAYTDTINYFVETPPVVDAGDDTAICAGSSVQLAAKVLIGTGFAPYKYLWNPTQGLSSTTKSNPIATPAATTTFHVTITDKFGCVATDSVIVTMNPPPQINPSLSDTICAGKQVVIGDSASGAKSPYIYKWLPRAGLSADDIATPVASPKATTTYTESVTDANGCSSQKSITVTVNALPIPVIAGPNAACVNSTAIYSNRGIGKGSYNWTLSGGGILTNLTNPDSVSVLWTTAGKWILTISVTNAQGCSADTIYKVDVGSTITPAITPSGNLSFCSGDSIVLHASNGYISYLWSDGSTADSLVVKQAGNFSVSVISNGGCSGTSDTTSITENPSPTVTVTADGPTHICSGGSVHLSASAGFSNYLWSTGETTQVITVSTAGSYTVQVTNNSGCSATSQPIDVTIDANLNPAILPAGSINLCQGDSVTLDAGSGYSTYQWSKDGSIITGATSEKILLVTSGSYTVDVTSGSCTGSSVPVVVTVFPLPPQPVITAAGTTLTSSTAITYQWQLNGQPISAATGQTINVSSNGSYSVMITDANGCSSTSAPFVFGVNASAIIAVGAVPSNDPGNKLEVPIELLSSQNLIPSNADHYIGTLRYNGTMLVPTGSNGGTISASSAITGSVERTINFEGHSSPMTSGSLQKILFDATLGNDTCTTLLIDTFYWTDATVNVTTENGDFCESGICFAGGGIRLINPNGTFGMGMIRPNPATNHILLEYDLLETGITKLILTDAIGRTVRTVSEADQKAGHYSIDIPLDDITSGYYRLFLETPSQILGQSFVVQK